MLSPLDSRRIANVVLVKNLDHASPEVQVQALEVSSMFYTAVQTKSLINMKLMRGKRNFTRTAVHAAPRPFLFIALIVSGTLRLNSHLVRQAA